MLKYLYPKHLQLGGIINVRSNFRHEKDSQNIGTIQKHFDAEKFQKTRTLNLIKTFLVLIKERQY